MKNFTLIFFLISCFFISSFGFSKDNLSSKNEKIIFFIPNFLDNRVTSPSIDNAILLAFFKKYPDLKAYQTDVTTLYKDRSYKAIWYDSNDINEFGQLMYHKLNSTYEQGIHIKIPYKDKI
jgi:hypothetical protein